MFFWINFILWCLIIYLFGTIFSLAFEPRNAQMPRWIAAAIYLLLNLPVAFIKITHTGDILGAIMYWLEIILAILYLILIFKDKTWKKILFFVMLLIVTYIGDIFCSSLLKYMGYDFDVSFNSMKVVFFVSLDIAIVLILSILLLIIWNRVVNYKKSGRAIWLFFIFPISQLIMLYFINGRNEIETFYNNLFACIGLLLGFLADIILLYVLMWQGVKEELEKQVQELERLYQLENVHYQSIEARRLEMAKLRHDFNNQLATVYHMIEKGDTNHSHQLLDELKAEIDRTKEYTYCGNPVINAVLNEKIMFCQEQDIRLETSLEVEEESNIQPVHMCSIFTNLIDNAIHAANDCPEGERFISVKAKRKGGYFHIKVENSSSEPRKRLSTERKSYGQQIIRDIAFRYNGEFQTDWRDGVYCSILSLTVEP